MGRSSAWMPVMLVTIYLFVGGIRGEAAVKTLDAANKTAPLKFHCIVCDDIKQQFCDPWDSFSHSKDCYQDERIDKTKPIGCRKMEQIIKDRKYVSRQCTNLVDDSIQGCIDRVGTKKIKVVYCHCRTPDCNAGRPISAGAGSWALHLLSPMGLWVLLAIGTR